MEALLCMEKSTMTNPKELEIINKAIHNHLEPFYVWGCGPLDDAEGHIVKVPLKRLHGTPTTWVHRQVMGLKRQQLVDDVVPLHGSKAKLPIFALLVISNLDSMEFMPYPHKLEAKLQMLSCDF